MPSTSTVKHAGNRALRKGRVSITGQAYVVTTVTHDRRQIFSGFDIACAASKTLSTPRLWPDAKLLAWVLMPDHVHLLIELGQREPLALVVQRVKSITATVLRRFPDMPDRIWQRGYHDHAIREVEDMKAAARYLVANPLRAGLAKDIGAYPFWDAIWLTSSP